MIRPRDGEMNFEKLEELSWNYMFISASLSEGDYNILKEEWLKQGGHKNSPWWLFVANNTKVELDIKKISD